MSYQPAKHVLLDSTQAMNLENKYRSCLKLFFKETIYFIWLSSIFKKYIDANIGC